MVSWQNRLILILCCLSGRLYGQKTTLESVFLGDRHATVYDLDYNRDGTLLATTQDNHINIWSTKDGQSIKELSGHASEVFALDFTADNRLVSGSKDGSLIVWNVNSGLATTRLQAHRAVITDVAFSPNGQLVASGSEDRQLRCGTRFLAPWSPILRAISKM